MENLAKKALQFFIQIILSQDGDIAIEPRKNTAKISGPVFVQIDESFRQEDLREAPVFLHFPFRRY
ncbi:MAG: hypothetical protein IJK89_11115 [Clostridia bacterium]|nr:hypothetical protein [Clostridia bacterium]